MKTLSLTELHKEFLGSLAYVDSSYNIQAINSSLENIHISEVTEDSRKTKKNSLFCAFKGDKSNGMKYIKSVIANATQVILTSVDEQEHMKEYLEDISFKDYEHTIFWFHENPRLICAKISALVYGPMPDNIFLITGTNGKTSTANFIYQILEKMQIKTATIGTLGVQTSHSSNYFGLTTPSSPMLHTYLHDLKAENINNVIIEASSHGLAQYRLDGLHPVSCGFTNLTQDHLDFHKTFEEYFLAKSQLFTRLSAKNTPAIINIDDEFGLRLVKLAQEKDLKVITYGKNENADYHINSLTTDHTGLRLALRYKNESYDLHFHMVGEFQVYNIICAIAQIHETQAYKDYEFQDILEYAKSLTSVEGRMELVAQTPKGASVYVDFAHTPDALEKALQSAKKHTTKRVISVFGCGGDRDNTKRPIMAKISSENAHITFVTDDNPRTEEPKSILKQVASGCVKGSNYSVVENRSYAIYQAMEQAEHGDIIIIAGKGHEKGQIIGTSSIPYDDHTAIRNANEVLKHGILYDSQTLEQITGGKMQGKNANLWLASGVSYSTLDIKHGDIFVALKGENSNGHKYINQAFEKGAVCVIADHRPEDVHEALPLLVVKDTTKSLHDMANYFRNHLQGKICAITGSAGKTTVKEMIGHILKSDNDQEHAGEKHTKEKRTKENHTKENHRVAVSQRSYNNHVGIPLSLARMYRDTQFAIQEIGMNHHGEIRTLNRIIKPHVVVITNVLTAHLKFFKDLQDIAQAKSEILENLDPENGIALLPYDNQCFNILQDKAKSLNLQNVYTFGEDDNCDFQLISYDEQSQQISARILEQEINYKTTSLGKHNALNTLISLAVAKLMAYDMSKLDILSIAKNFASFPLLKGRGEIHDIRINDHNLTLIDESYNANPDSMKASISTLDNMKSEKILLLTQMLELGEQEKELHTSILESILLSQAKTVGLLYMNKDVMIDLYHKLKSHNIKVEMFQDINEIVQYALSHVTQDTTILVKGSNGSKALKIVQELLTLTN